MFVDIGADLWGSKENIRIEVPQHVLKQGSISDFVRLVNAVYTQEMQRTAPLAKRVTARSLAFDVESIRLLTLDRTVDMGRRWTLLRDVSELTPYCQLFAFQGAEGRLLHGDGQNVLPVARLVVYGVRAAVPSLSPPRSAAATSPRSSAAPVCSSSPSQRQSPQRLPVQASPSTPPPQRHGRGSPSTGSAIKDRRISIKSKFATVPPVEVIEDPTECVFHFCCTGVLGRAANERPLPQLTADAAMVSRLLHAVGVNLLHWQDPEFRFLASEHECRIRRIRMTYESFIVFSNLYKSLLKLMHRHLVDQYGSTIATQPRTGNNALFGLEEVSVEGHRGWSPPRTTPSLYEPRSSQDKRQSPPRPQSSSPNGSPSHRKQSKSCQRLFLGLSSITTAKDRKLNLYDPLL